MRVVPNAQFEISSIFEEGKCALLPILGNIDAENRYKWTSAIEKALLLVLIRLLHRCSFQCIHYFESYCAAHSGFSNSLNISLTDCSVFFFFCIMLIIMARLLSSNVLQMVLRYENERMVSLSKALRYSKHL